MGKSFLRKSFSKSLKLHHKYLLNITRLSLRMVLRLKDKLFLNPLCEIKT